MGRDNRVSPHLLLQDVLKATLQVQEATLLPSFSVRNIFSALPGRLEHDTREDHQQKSAAELMGK